MGAAGRKLPKSPINLAICFCLGGFEFRQGAEQLLTQIDSHGAVETLVNNAGIFSVEDFSKSPDEEWLRYFQTNVMSMIRLCRALMPGMLERNRGSIVNVSSEAAIKPLPQMIHYSMTKTAMLSISRGLAELTKGTAVRVNSLLPGQPGLAAWKVTLKAWLNRKVAPLKRF